MRLVSIQVGCPEEIHDCCLLEIPDDWDLEKLKKEYREWYRDVYRPSLLIRDGGLTSNLKEGEIKYQEFSGFLKERGAKELHFERFSGD